MHAWRLQWLYLLALLGCAPLVHAQVFHCVGAHGEPVFAGEPCGSPAPATGDRPTTPATHFIGACATSPAVLSKSIDAAFASHDLNHLAGLILWQGMDRTATRVSMQSLAAWLQQPLAGIAIAYPTGPPATNSAMHPGAPPASAAPDAQTRVPIGFEISTGGDDGETRDFGVTEFGGCWWLTF